LTKIKASLKAASEPDWAAEFDRQQMAKMLGGGPFSVNDHEAHEAERIQAQNRQLAERNRRHEEQRRAQVAGDEPEPEPWWRR
jgi:hypothetical protein